LITEKITLIITAWIVVVFFITGDIDLEIYFVLIFIGVLVVRELTDVFTTDIIKEKMDFFIYMLLIVFIVIFIKTIINLL